ncbi:MAG: ABC transporter ATP-binding protein [Candidatus Dormibacteraceae bacterium]
MAEVEVRGLKKTFGGGYAVDGIDLRCEDGEYLVLLGPSGCGKTTLLRMIAGLEEPSAGHILIGGNVVTGLPPRARKIAMVFQSYALYPHKTVRKNIAFPLEAEGLTREQRATKVAWASALLGIEQLLDRKPRMLSGGERQRVALARALVREPQVFLLDEPLSNLDAKLRATARVDLKEFQRRVGVSTIYVTHDQVEAMGLGDRIVVLNKGRLQQVGTPDEIYNHPANVFVATFVGSPPMNLIERDGRLVGFRPECFKPTEADGHGPGLRLEGRVTRIENLGSDRYVYVTVKGDSGEARVISKLPAGAPLAVEVDAPAQFSIAERDLRFFDRESELRVDAAGPLGVR